MLNCLGVKLLLVVVPMYKQEGKCYGVSPAMVVLQAMKDAKQLESALQRAIIARLCDSGRILPNEPILRQPTDNGGFVVYHMKARS